MVETLEELSSKLESPDKVSFDDIIKGYYLIIDEVREAIRSGLSKEELKEVLEFLSDFHADVKQKRRELRKIITDLQKEVAIND